jgi:hypothetical protein
VEEVPTLEVVVVREEEPELDAVEDPDEEYREDNADEVGVPETDKLRDPESSRRRVWSRADGVLPDP